MVVHGYHQVKRKSNQGAVSMAPKDISYGIYSFIGPVIEGERTKCRSVQSAEAQCATHPLRSVMHAKAVGYL